MIFPWNKEKKKEKKSLTALYRFFSCYPSLQILHQHLKLRKISSGKWIYCISFFGETHKSLPENHFMLEAEWIFLLCNLHQENQRAQRPPQPNIINIENSTKWWPLPHCNCKIPNKDTPIVSCIRLCLLYVDHVVHLQKQWNAFFPSLVYFPGI